MTPRALVRTGSGGEPSGESSTEPQETFVDPFTVSSSHRMRSMAIASRLLLVWVLSIAADTLVAQTPATPRLEEQLVGGVGWNVLGTIGEFDTFGSIDGIEVVGGDRVVVLDRMNSRVSLFTMSGVHLARYGKTGGGPGEFSRPSAISVTLDSEVLVLDPGNGRLSVLGIQDDSLFLSEEIRLPFAAMGLCAAGSRVFLLGHHDGHLIHDFERNGTVSRSYVPVGGRDAFEVALLSNGRLACSEERRQVALASRMLGHLEVLSIDESSVLEVSIPNYVETIYHRHGNAIRPAPPPDGYAHETTGLNWLGRTVIVQVSRVPSGDIETLETRLFSLDGGWSSFEPRWPQILLIHHGQVFTVENDPFPVVRVYHVQEEDRRSRS